MEAAGPADGPARLHQLDGLRAVAVTLVFVYHLGINSATRWMAGAGHDYAANFLGSFTMSGVELFFVLSGTVLLRPHLRRGRSLQVGTYLRRRIERLWPPYLAAWALAGLVILLTTLYPTWWTTGAMLPTFSLGGWLAQLGIIYTGEHYNFAWWTLTVELLFYASVLLIVPVLLWWRPGRAQMIGVWLVSCAVAVAAQHVHASVVADQLSPLRALLFPNELSGRSMVVYASCFAGGVLVAGHDLPARWGRWAMLAGTAYLLLAFRWTGLNAHVGWGLVYLGLLVVSLDSTTASARWLSSWPVVWLGERSYSLFLLHYTVFTGVCHATSLVTAQKGGRYYLITRAVEVPLALLAAMAVFFFIEKRFARNLSTAGSFWPTRPPGWSGAKTEIAASPARSAGISGAASSGEGA